MERRNKIIVVLLSVVVILCLFATISIFNKEMVFAQKYLSTDQVNVRYNDWDLSTVTDNDGNILDKKVRIQNCSGLLVETSGSEITVVMLNKQNKIIVVDTVVGSTNYGIYPAKKYSVIVDGLTVYLYEANECKVTLKANGGIGQDVELEVDFDNTISLKDCDKYFSNYPKEFLHWNTKEDDSGSIYEKDSVISKIESDFSLYAIWLDDLRIEKVSLTLENNLKMNYKLLNSVENHYTDLSISFDLNGKKTIVSDYIKQDYLVFSFDNIAPQLMGDKIKATLSGKRNGNIVTAQVFEYSIKEYCMELLSTQSQNTKLRTLVVDILNYGSACQKLENYKKSDLANKDLNSTQSSWASSDREYVDLLDKNYQKISSPQATIVAGQTYLHNAIDLQFLVEAQDGVISYAIVSVDGIEHKIDFDKFISTYEKGKKYYQFFFYGLNATDISKPVYITIYNSSNQAISNTIRYSVESYCYNKKNSTYNGLAETVKMIVRYGDSAKNYAT